jgi:hypothetical protein
MTEVVIALAALIVMRGMGLDLERKFPPRSAEDARSGPNGEDAGSNPVGATNAEG